MPAAGVMDVLRKGDFRDTSLQAVASFLADCPNAVFRPGLFPDYVENDGAEKFAFVHMGADLYASTAAALAWFYPRMVSGGIIVLDDYLWPRCPGVKMALDEFMSGKQDRIFYYNYQAVIVLEAETTVSCPSLG